ncbi:MAG: DOMON-like domain-containing protein [Phormidesmis sp.]
MNPPITFSLQPFKETAEATNLVIVVTVARRQDTLSLSYILKGDLGKVAIPTRRETPQRKDRLWQQTCFEFFIAADTNRTHSTPYWEFNLSPSQDWNVFSLSGYRQGRREEKAFSSLPIYTGTLTHAIYLEASVNIGRLIDASKPVRVGVSAVVVSADKEESFWAIAHPTFQSTAADFHHPDSFAIELAP